MRIRASPNVISSSPSLQRQASLSARDCGVCVFWHGAASDGLVIAPFVLRPHSWSVVACSSPERPIRVNLSPDTPPVVGAFFFARDLLRKFSSYTAMAHAAGVAQK